MKNISYYIEKAKNGSVFGGVESTKAYPFAEDGVILINKQEEDYEEKRKIIEKCKLLGINIPGYIDFIEQNGDYWVLEELAPGEQLAQLINNENGVNIVKNIPYSHIEKYIRDVYLLEQNGIGIEPRRRNIFYDKEKGFTTIDVALLSKIPNPDSLESVNYFFQMYNRFLMVNFSDDNHDNLVYQQLLSKMMMAFEKGHPYFNKYKRWIYRNDKSYGNFCEEEGYDLSLTAAESAELVTFIADLINRIVEEKMNGAELTANSHVGYMQLLEESIMRCKQFDLFDINTQRLNEYIESCVYTELKNSYLKDHTNDKLRELYFQVRRREIDPNFIYDTDALDEYIERELQNIKKPK